MCSLIKKLIEQVSVADKENETTNNPHIGNQTTWIAYRSRISSLLLPYEFVVILSSVLLKLSLCTLNFGGSGENNRSNLAIFSSTVVQSLYRPHNWLRCNLLVVEKAKTWVYPNTCKDRNQWIVISWNNTMVTITTHVTKKQKFGWAEDLPQYFEGKSGSCGLRCEIHSTFLWLNI